MGYWFVWELPRQAHPQIGRNSVSMELVSRDPTVMPEVQVMLHDVELEIRYLMGRRFHRHVGESLHDPDLGPHVGHTPRL